MSALPGILEGYKRTREKHEQALRDRRAQAYSLLPRLREISEAIEKEALTQLDAVLKDPFDADAAIEACGKRLDALKKERELLLSKHQNIGDMLTLKHDCPQCQDTGFIDGRRCTCLVEKLIKSGDIDLPLLAEQNFNTFNLSIFPETANGFKQRSIMENVYKKLKTYTQEYPNNQLPNVLIFGNTGLGKTFLLSCVTKELLEKGYNVLSFTAYRFFARLLDYHIGKSDTLEDILNADLLIIDDLGSEPEYKNVNVNYFFMVLNERLVRKKHTINLMPTELVAKYSERIYARLSDKSSTLSIMLSGKDLRLIK